MLKKQKKKHLDLADSINEFQDGNFQELIGVENEKIYSNEFSVVIFSKNALGDVETERESEQSSEAILSSNHSYYKICSGMKKKPTKACKTRVKHSLPMSVGLALKSTSILCRPARGRSTQELVDFRVP